MFIIIGLGNPGKEYELTRHNVGFIVIDELAKQLNVEWKFNKRSNAEVAKTRLADQELILVKPQTFMNLSGRAVRALMLEVRNKRSDLIVVHDDIDLEFGTIRVSFNSSSAGHKGVQSIIEHLGTKEFWRIRVGIKPIYKLQATSYKLDIDTPEFVLKRFSREEKIQLPTIISQAVEITEQMITNQPKVQTIHCLN